MTGFRDITILSHHVFGDLVKGWSNDPTTKPKTMGDLRKALNAAQNCADIGPGFDDAELIHYAELPPMSRQFSLVIPHKEDIALELPEGSYPLPDFYGILAFGKVKAAVADTDRETFRSSRIADYSANKCM